MSEMLDETCPGQKVRSVGQIRENYGPAGIFIRNRIKSENVVRRRGTPVVWSRIFPYNPDTCRGDTLIPGITGLTLVGKRLC